MENKKYFLSLLIIMLVLFLGVGYAVVSSVYIKTGGTANVSDYELNVEITNAVASTNITDKTVDFSHALSNKNLTSNFTLNGMALGEVVTITYTVTNNEKDVDAILELTTGEVLTNSNPDYFTVNYEIIDGSTNIKNGDNIMTVVVTVELYKTPVSEAGGSTSVSLSLSASPKDSNGGADVDSGEVEQPKIMYKLFNKKTGLTTISIDTFDTFAYDIFEGTISAGVDGDKTYTNYNANEYFVSANVPDPVTLVIDKPFFTHHDSVYSVNKLSRNLLNITAGELSDYTNIVTFPDGVKMEIDFSIGVFEEISGITLKIPSVSYKFYTPEGELYNSSTNVPIYLYDEGTKTFIVSTEDTIITENMKIYVDREGILSYTVVNAMNK